MGTYHDLIQRAVVGAGAVVSALRNGTLDTLVRIAVHCIFLLFIGICSVCPFGRIVCEIAICFFRGIMIQ